MAITLYAKSVAKIIIKLEENLLRRRRPIKNVNVVDELES